jgi:acyl-CoA synthetase (AMP-forming)/AMP-acid ligase II/3-oxoacyl-(acyl-carrier-protein) synthase/thioesterase domain-containing protein/acyl carrier protein
MNVAQWDLEHARRFGNEVGLVIGNREWTNHELHDRACRLARAFIANGVEPGSRVAIVLPNSLELYVASAAATMAGCIVAVLPMTSTRELDAIFAHCDPAVVIAGDASLPAYDASRSLRLRIVPSRSADTPAGVIMFDELVGAHAPLEAPVPRDAQDPVQLCFTSGSSGRPKAAVYTHGGVDLFWRARVAATGDPEPRRVVLIGIPPTAFGARFIGMRAIANHQYIVLPKFDPAQALAAISRYRVQEMPLLPTMAEQLAAWPDAPDLDSVSLRSINIAGAHVSASLVRRLKERFASNELSVVVHYGMTETGGGFASTSTGGDGAVGRVTPGTLVRIVGRDGEDVPPGENGEVVVRAPFAAAGYWRDPEQTSAVFRDGFVHTGDLGCLDPDMQLHILGRIKDIIIQGGFNVLPAEVESVVGSVPGVQECAVLGISNELLGEEVVACVVRAPRASVSEIEIRVLCRNRLDSRKQPARILFFDQLPRMTGGKLDARLLRQLVLERNCASLDTIALHELEAAERATRILRLRELVQRELSALLAESPGTEIPAEDSLRSATFGELGLTSIGAVRLTRRLGELLATDLSPTLIYSSPTLQALSEAIDRIRWKAEPRGESVAPRKDVEPAATTIAITGIGCRLPGGVESPAAFWELLCSGRDVVRAVPPARGATRGQGAFLDNAEGFDAAFFRLAEQAADMDPRHRMLLEVAWEALENAGYNPLALNRERTGVFLGIYGDRYASRDPLATAPGMAVSFLCQFLDIGGPVVSIDTTCSSSLVAIHQAVQSLQLGECDTAIVGGVNLISPGVLENALGVMSSDGRSRAFDAAADGFGAGEGCVLLVLRRLNDGLDSGDRVYATILGTAIAHDGRSTSLTAPNPGAQERVIRLALARSNMPPEAVQYVEAHGTATILGDPIEVEALARVFAARSGPPLAIGSVKTNIGHLEAAAGAASLAKLALALQARHLPASLHFSHPNPHIPWGRIPIRVQATAGDWPSPSERLIAGVSSFGMSGTNAHVLVSEPPPVIAAELARSAAAASSEEGWILPLSARSQRSLGALAARWADSLARAPERYTCRDFAYTASCRRAHLDFRLAIAGRTREDWVSALRSFADAAVCGAPAAQLTKQLTMVFDGSGEVWRGMGRELLGSQPVFRAAIERCAFVIERCIGSSLMEELRRDTADARSARAELVRPALFALQIALVELWRSWGVEPTAAVGVGVGAIAADCVAGRLSLEQGARLVCRSDEPIPESARFMDTCRTLLGDGHRAFVEVGPRSELAAALRSTAQELGLADEVTIVSSVNPPSALDSMLEALGSLHCSGFEVDWSRRYAVRGRVADLPNTAWVHVPFWQADQLAPVRCNSAPAQLSADEIGGARQQLLEWLATSAQLEVSELPAEATLGEIGIDSLGCIRLRAKVLEKFGVNIPMTDWTRDATPNDLIATFVRAIDGTDAKRSPDRLRLTWMKPAGTDPTIVWIHPVGGGVSCYRVLARSLPFRSVGIASPALFGERAVPETIEDMARQYIRLLPDIPDASRLVLAGWSLGGVVAYEMAIQLAKTAAPVELVTMIDSYPPRGQSTLASPSREGTRALVRITAPGREVSMPLSVLRAFMRDLSGTSEGRANAVEEWLTRQLSAGGSFNLSELVAEARVRGLLREIHPEDGERLLRAFTTNWSALTQYRVPAYDGRVLSIRASQAIGEPDSAWRAYASRIQVQRLDGDHYSIMSASALPELMRILSRWWRQELGEPHAGIASAQV